MSIPFSFPEFTRSTLSPEQKWQKLMSRRNEWKLYPRKCDATGESILSAYSDEVPFPVYKNSVWWGDTWEATKYGRDFDFSRPFFEQFNELMQVVPREGTSIFNSINCDYNSHVRESKNCYLNSLAARSEDVLYSYWMVNTKDALDCMLTNDSTLCYECSFVNNCYNCVMLEESNNCSDSYFSFQLRGCKNCLFCTNLNNKNYYIFNKACSKEEFEEAKAKILNGSWKSLQEAREKYKEIKQNAVHRATHGVNCENCSGDHIYNSKNSENCYDSFNCEDCIDTISGGDGRNLDSCYSAGWPACELVYFSSVSRGCQNIAFCSYMWFSNNMRYCDSCVSSEDCFGCTGLRRKKYCVLNKEYSKEDYASLLAKIKEHMQKIGEWGEFFPNSLSPFAYNESAAQDFYPIEKDEAIKQGWRWKEIDAKEYKPATLKELPDNIKDVPESITNEILACESTGKNYKITKQELAFYKKMGLPLPRNCPEFRHKVRSESRNPFKLWERKCAKTGKTILTSYSPDRPEIIYSEEAFLEEME